jgi:hypothetical protein
MDVGGFDFRGAMLAVTVVCLILTTAACVCAAVRGTLFDGAVPAVCWAVCVLNLLIQLTVHRRRTAEGGVRYHAADPES